MAQVELVNFSVADFNRMIPEFKGDSKTLLVFLKRCDTFHDTLNDEGNVPQPFNIQIKR